MNLLEELSRFENELFFLIIEYSKNSSFSNSDINWEGTKAGPPHLDPHLDPLLDLSEYKINSK
jgi:hypothetical protein